MKLKILANATIAFMAAFGSIANAENAQSTQSHIDTLKWIPMPFGPSISPVFGDPTKGQHVTLVRFEPGMTSSVHIHSHDYVGVVVQGTGQHFEESRPETKVDLSAGSHWFMPANVPHVSTCTSDEACLFVLFQNEAFDYHDHDH